MIFNFEHEIAGVLYDVDAETKLADTLVVLLEVRIVDDNGGFVVLDIKTADERLLAELVAAAAADYMDRCSP